MRRDDRPLGFTMNRNRLPQIESGTSGFGVDSIRVLDPILVIESHNGYDIPDNILANITDDAPREPVVALDTELRRIRPESHNYR